MKDKEPKNCWEFHNCSETVRAKCPAYIYQEGRRCWEVASSFYNTGCPKTRGKGMIYCVKECLWFKQLNPSSNKE